MRNSILVGICACALVTSVLAAADAVSKGTGAAPATQAASQPAAPVIEAKPRPAPAILTPVAGWKADNDLYAQKWKLKKGLQLTMPIKGRPQIFGSARPTPFLVVADRNPAAGDFWYVLDVRTGNWPARLQMKTAMQRATISPDGQYAGGAMSDSSAEIWSLKTGTFVSSLVGPAGTREMNVVGFLEGGLVATYSLSNEAGVVQVWDVKTAKALREIKLKNRPAFGAVALSPNGKYLAAYDGAVRLIDLTTCTEAGVASLPGLKQAEAAGSARQEFRFQRLAWALDGCEVGVLLGAGRITYSEELFRVVTWDMPTGQVITDIVFDKPEEQRGGGECAFEIVPDNSGFRLGLTVVDREAGKSVCTLPNPVPGQQFAFGNYLQVTQMYDGERLLFAAAPAGNRVGILALELPRDRMAKIADSIKAGGRAIDAGMPALTATNSAGARAVLASGTGDTWTYKPDTPAAATRPANFRSVLAFPLRQPRGIGNGPLLEVGSIRLSGLPGNQALVTYNTRVNVDNHMEFATAALERINLATGGLLASFNPPHPRSTAMDLAADGRQVLFLTEDRLDLYSTADGGAIKHLLGWRPYGLMKNKYDAPLAHAAIVDSTHVLTLSRGGDGYVWNVPDGAALYHFKTSSGGRPALSPTRKHLAFQDTAGITILDAVKGDVLASMVAPSEDRDQCLVFHPDGTLLASYSPQWQVVMVWDLGTGKLVKEFNLPTSVRNATTITWCGREHLMIGSNLVNLAHRMVVWQYTMEHNQSLTAAGGNMPDDRYWTTLGGAQVPAILATVLPHEDARKAIAALPPDKECVLRPGLAVTLEVNILGSEETRKDITARLTRALAANGMTVAEGQPLHIVAATNSVAGEAAQYGQGFMGNINPQTVSIPQYEHRLAFTHEGKTLWERTGRSMGMSPGSVRVGESVQAAIDKMNAEPSRGFFSTFRLPKYLSEGSDGLGYSALTAKGPIDATRPSPR